MTAVPKCSFSPCDRPSKVKGLCAAHYHQQWLGKPLTPIGVRGGPAPRRVGQATIDELAERVAEIVIERLRAEGIVPESPNRGP